MIRNKVVWDKHYNSNRLTERNIFLFCYSRFRLMCTFKKQGFHIWHVCSLWQDLSDVTVNFDHVTLIVTFGLNLENFNFAINFLTIRHWVFIFGRCVPYDKTFPMVP